MNLPAIGFGTSPYRPDGTRVDVEEPVRIALDAGYRLFDVAEMYGNERAVGRALHGSSAQIIGKLWRTNFRPEHVRRACEDSLRRLGLDAFDLYLMHASDAWQHVAPLEDPETIGWDEFVRRGAPGVADDVPLRETWAAMRSLVDAGLARAIGVSNFTPEQVASLDPRPAANEIPCWPLVRHDIPILGYSPLKFLDAPVIRDIAAAHARTPAQVVLRWLMQQGVRPLTFSVNASHIREGLGALELEWDASEFDAIARLTASR